MGAGEQTMRRVLRRRVIEGFWGFGWQNHCQRLGTWAETYLLQCVEKGHSLLNLRRHHVLCWNGEWHVGCAHVRGNVRLGVMMQSKHPVYCIVAAWWNKGRGQ